MRELVSYIENCRKKGFSDRYIRKVLKDAGHQDFVVRRAFSHSKGGRKKVNSRNFLLSLVLILGIISVMGIVALFNFEESSPSGYIVNAPTQPPVQEVNNEQAKLIAAKNQVLEQQIQMIRGLDLTVEEQERLIIEQTRKIDELFIKIQTERTENLNASIELINSLLVR
ncbi:hypothetical protein KY321_05560 [Candidatus Woesearchaeota archaeon]|nr:hypothetical protein [Candidatus Woesearchaeota archaeon]